MDVVDHQSAPLASEDATGDPMTERSTPATAADDAPLSDVDAPGAASAARTDAPQAQTDDPDDGRQAVPRGAPRRAPHARFAAGVAGLDVLTGGGLPAGRLHLIAGEPGAGKSILAHQLGADVVRAGGTVLYLTIHTESHHTLLEQARTLSFFDPAIVAAERFRYVSLSAALDEGGLTAVRERVGGLVQAYAPTLVVLDGLHMVKVLGADMRAYHQFLRYLQAQATLAGLTTLVLTNYDDAAPADPMYAVPDGILHLRTERYAQREVRRICVGKLRGSAALTGWHDYTLDADGVHIHPRLEAWVRALGLPPRQPAGGRDAFGVPGLDALLDGGVPGASVTLLAGAPGAGKTLLGLAFLAAGAARGERGLYVGFRETGDRVLAKADGVGLRLRPWVDAGLVTLHWEAPLEPLADALAEALLERALGPAWDRPHRGHLERDAAARPAPRAAGDAPRVRRLFIDGLDDLRRTCLEPSRVPNLLAALTDVLRAHGASLVLSQEFSQPFGPDLALPIEEMSAAVDNIILLRYVEGDTRIERRLSVLKVREHAYDDAIRAFTISARGIMVESGAGGADASASEPTSASTSEPTGGAEGGAVPARAGETAKAQAGGARGAHARSDQGGDPAGGPAGGPAGDQARRQAGGQASGSTDHRSRGRRRDVRDRGGYA